ncbi:hypothetical protein D3C86_1541880 [compost metagenome]
MAEHVAEARRKGARLDPVNTINLVRPGHGARRHLIAPAPDPHHVLGQPQRLQTRRLLPHGLGVFQQIAGQTGQLAQQRQLRLGGGGPRLDVHDADGAHRRPASIADRRPGEEADARLARHQGVAPVFRAGLGVLDHEHRLGAQRRQMVAHALQPGHADFLQADAGSEHGAVLVQHGDHGVGRVERGAGDGGQPVERIAFSRVLRPCSRNNDPHASPLSPARRIIR